jgi:hypothetical protein
MGSKGDMLVICPSAGRGLIFGMIGNHAFGFG